MMLPHTYRLVPPPPRWKEVLSLSHFYTEFTGGQQRLRGSGCDQQVQGAAQTGQGPGRGLKLSHGSPASS